MARLFRQAFGKESSPSVPELPAGTIIAAFSHCSCNACGASCDPDEPNHTWPTTRLFGNGCGIVFTHVTTRSEHPAAKNATRRMRPDLIFIEYPAEDF
jgi:hypothetical protein